MFELVRRSITIALVFLIGTGIAAPVTPRAQAGDAVVAAAAAPEPKLPERLLPSATLTSVTPRADLTKLPLHFEANVGQAPANVRYAATLGDTRSA